MAAASTAAPHRKRQRPHEDGRRATELLLRRTLGFFGALRHRRLRARGALRSTVRAPRLDFSRSAHRCAPVTAACACSMNASTASRSSLMRPWKKCPVAGSSVTAGAGVSARAQREHLGRGHHAHPRPPARSATGTPGRGLGADIDAGDRRGHQHHALGCGPAGGAHRDRAAEGEPAQPQRGLRPALARRRRSRPGRPRSPRGPRHSCRHSLPTPR